MYEQKQILISVAFTSENLPEKPLSPEMIIFYITQDTQRHPLLSELKSGCFLTLVYIYTQIPWQNIFNFLYILA